VSPGIVAVVVDLSEDIVAVVGVDRVGRLFEVKDTVDDPGVSAEASTEAEAAMEPVLAVVAVGPDDIHSTCLHHSESQ
jgi:hypothetical protein